MFQNLKVDVIYHKTNTDFEMEFNLCGCCRMRLLTDKTPDKKTMVHSLARAVSRSRVILIIGNLFGEEGIINIAAGAIGSRVVPADNKAYGISGEESIEIIDSSIPLVTSDGYFGGCIIESGPQTLILLSENKNIRKTVMKSLIHPYIEELCAMELKEKAESAVTADSEEAPLFEMEEENVPEEQSEQTEPQDELTEEDSTEEEEEEEIPEETDSLDLIFEDGEEDELDGDELVSDDDSEIEMVNIGDSDFPDEDGMVDSEMLFEDNTISMREFVRRNEDYYREKEMVKDLVTDDEEIYLEKRKSLNIPIFIISVLLLILIAVLCYCIFYIPSKDGVSASIYLNDIFNSLFG